ncbi:MAG TPA: 50S ribosomal protein L10 [Candidatus Scatovicinus merdipullorum]|nr:50S ribosomal protein L10 [Candidatus Scatovicinus merdipullorum]
MPSEKILEQKKAIVAELTDRLQNSVAGVLVNYKGISVADDTKLRKELREAGVQYTVVKNTLLLRAAQNANLAGLEPVLENTTALATSAEDYVAAAKILSAYAEKNKNFEIKAGFVDGGLLEVNEIKDLAKLPGKEELVAKALGGLNAPISGFVAVLNGNLRGLVCALNAIAQQKQEA